MKSVLECTILWKKIDVLLGSVFEVPVLVQNSNLVGAKFKISKTSQPKFASEFGYWTFSSLVEHFRNVFETVQAFLQLTKTWNLKILIGCKVTQLDEFFGPRILSWIESRLKYFFCEWARFLSSAAFSVIVQNPPKLRTFFRDFQELFISLEKFILAFKNFYPSFQQQRLR